MIRDHEGRWLWSAESQNQFAEAQISLPIVEPTVDEAARKIIFASTNIPSLLGMTPVLSLNANGRYLPTRMNGSYQIASVDDAERGSTLKYFGLPSSDIIIQADDGAEVFPDGDSWTFDRKGITEYGELTNVNVEVSSVPDGRQFMVNLEVELKSYLGDASKWNKSMKFNNILHVRSYLNRELPWSRFRLDCEYEFSHLLIFPGEAKRANTCITRRGKMASCRFTLQLRGYQTLLFCGLFIGGDRKPYMILSRNYANQNEVGYFEIYRGFGVTLAKPEISPYIPDRTSSMLLHPSLYDELNRGSCFHNTVCTFEPLALDGPSFKQIHIALGPHQHLDSNPPSDRVNLIEDFRLICENIDVTKDIINNLRILLNKKHGGRRALDRGVLADHQLINLTMDSLASTNGIKILKLEGLKDISLSAIFAQKHVLVSSLYRPGSYSLTSSTGFNESRFDNWAPSQGRYVLMNIVSMQEIDFAGLYLHFMDGSDSPSLAHFRLRPSNAREKFVKRHRRAAAQIQGRLPLRLHPSKLHEILFSSPGMNKPEDFLYSGLPLAMFHINNDVWCLCLERESDAPIIMGLNYENGSTSRLVLEFDEGDKRWHLPETQRALESNPVYSWLLSLLEVME